MKTLIDSIGITILILGWWIALSSYPRLPETIPMHFGIKGDVDGWGGRWTIFLLPVIATLIFALDLWIFNRPDVIARTPASLIIPLHLLVMEMAALFTYLTWRISAVAFGKASGIGYWFWILLLAVMFTGGYVAIIASQQSQQP
jgi:hypothetical protein